MNAKRLALLAAAFAGAAALFPAAGMAQRAPAVADILISGGDPQIQAGRTTKFYATAYDKDNNAIASVTAFHWRSSNPQYATIDDNGVATGVAPGTTQITARYGSGRSLKTSQQPVTLQVVGGEGAAPQPQSVAAPPQPVVSRGAPAPRTAGPGCGALAWELAGSGQATGLVVNPVRVHLVKGESKQLEAYAVRSDGGHATPVCIQLTIEEGGEGVAEVDSATGIVRAMEDTGQAVVKAVVPENQRWQPREISVDVHADSVRFNVRDTSLAPGATDTLALIVPAQGNRRIESQMFQFSSSDSSKVRVLPLSAIVTALAPGSARITATNSRYPEITTTVYVHKPIRRSVGTPLDTLIILPVHAVLPVGVRYLAGDSSTIDSVPVRWTGLDSTVARFDSVKGTLHGIRVGETRMTASVLAERDSSFTRRWHVRVVAGGLQFATPRFGLPVDSQKPLTVQVLDDRRQPVLTATGLTWRSTADSVARVTADGHVTGVTMGRAQLTAKAPSPWDSMTTADAYVVGDLLVPAQRGTKWDLLMVQRGDPPRVRPLLEDSVQLSQPVWSPSWTHIAYAAATNVKGDGFDIYVANADGSEPRRLVHDSLVAHSPVFVGPADDQIVFEAGRGRRMPTQLYVIHTDGSARRQLTTGDNPNSQPDVSPDGKRVLFVSVRDHNNSNIYQMNIDGTGAEEHLTTGKKEDAPAYAPDGKSFYYLRDEGGSPPTRRVYRQDLTPGAVATAITSQGVNVQAFSVSADNKTLAITVLPAERHAIAHVELFVLATSTGTPLVLPGVAQMGGPEFRPAPQQAPPPAPAQH